MTRPERTLVLLLRGLGCLTLSAFAAIALPVEWMAAIHARLGLGTLPREPIVDYLTRSVSAFYGLHGALLLVVARDVRRHRAVVAFAGWAAVAFGVIVTGIDLHAGMPAWWTWGEGLPVTALGALQLYLLRSVPREDA